MKELPAHLKRQLVDYRTKEPTGTVIIDTARAPTSISCSATAKPSATGSASAARVSPGRATSGHLAHVRMA